MAKTTLSCRRLSRGKSGAVWWGSISEFRLSRRCPQCLGHYRTLETNVFPSLVKFVALNCKKFFYNLLHVVAYARNLMMSYTFDILGVTPMLTFFNYQQQVECNPQRSMAYLASFNCTLDGLIDATDLIPQKPDWDWDMVIGAMVKFWVHHESLVEQWRQEMISLGEQSLLVGRIANTQLLRQQFESLI